MTKESLHKAIQEAERFIAAAKAAHAEYRYVNYGPGGYWNQGNGKLNGTCKRASLDLTRALAEMRRP